MKNILFIRLFLVAVFAVSFFSIVPSIAMAEHPHELGEDVHEEGEELHGHTGMHGGYFADADDRYHFEFLLNSEGLLKVYLYDGKIQPLSVTGIPARWVLAPDNAYPLKGNFQESEDGGYYWVQFPATESEIIHLEVSAVENGEWVGTEYYLPVGEQVSESSAEAALTH